MVSHWVSTDSELGARTEEPQDLHLIHRPFLYQALEGLRRGADYLFLVWAPGPLWGIVTRVRLKWVCIGRPFSGVRL